MLHAGRGYFNRGGARPTGTGLAGSAFVALNSPVTSLCTGLEDIEKLEAVLWTAAENLRANSHKSSTEYRMSVLAVIFLCHAANRYDAACREMAPLGRDPSHLPPMS